MKRKLLALACGLLLSLWGAWAELWGPSFEQIASTGASPLLPNLPTPLRWLAIVVAPFVTVALVWPRKRVEVQPQWQKGDCNG